MSASPCSPGPLRKAGRLATFHRPAASLTTIGAFERATVGWFDLARKTCLRPGFGLALIDLSRS